MHNIKKIAQDYNIIKPKINYASEFDCQVRQLDENEMPLSFKVCRDSDGQWLLDEVCERLGGIHEKDYFGLRYTDKDKQIQWLDLGKNISYQMKERRSFFGYSKYPHKIVVSFRIKHYPELPLSDLKQDLARNFLYLQLRRDLYSGRLLGRSSDLFQLAAFAVQKQLGDFDVKNEDVRYLSDLKLLPNLNSKTEAKIIDIHKTLIGVTAVEAETKFLESACQLDTYGVEPFYVKDQKGNNLYVGLTHAGVSTFQGSRQAHLFKWADIAKIHYQGKMFIIQVFLDEVLNNEQSKKKHVLGFKCETSFAAAALWKWANDRMYFFSLNRSSDAKRVKSGGGVFRRLKTFRFAGRCQKELKQISASMMQINERESIGLERRNTYAESDNVLDVDYQQDRLKYNTMPSRDRGLSLGTQETLDSLFLSNHRDLIDTSGPQSHVYSPIGSPKIEAKSCQATTQSLEHITEETQVVQPDNIECQSGFLITPEEEKVDISRTSSKHLSTSSPLSNSQLSLKRRQSESDGDITGALQQLHLAVAETVDKEIIRVVQKGHFGHYLTRCLCVGFLVSMGLLMSVFVALMVVVLKLHYQNDGSSYDYSGIFYDIISNPSKAIKFAHPQQFSQIVRDGFLEISKYFTS